jgi:hypothetical protein
MPHLHSNMRRLTSTQTKAPTDPDNEPDFYRMRAVYPLPVFPLPAFPLPSADVASEIISPAEDEIANFNRRRNLASEIISPADGKIALSQSQRNFLIDIYARGVGISSLPPTGSYSDLMDPLRGGLGQNFLCSSSSTSSSSSYFSGGSSSVPLDRHQSRRLPGLVRTNRRFDLGSTTSTRTDTNDIQRFADVNDIQREHATIGGARQTMEFALGRLEEHEEKLRRHAVMRSARPPPGRLPGRQAHGTPFGRPIDVRLIEPLNHRHQLPGTSLNPERSLQGNHRHQLPGTSLNPERSL